MADAPNPKELLLKIAPRLPLFYGLGIGVLEDLIRCGSLLSIKQGEKMVKEGEVSDSFIIILSGEAIVEKKVKGEIVKIAQLKSGDCVGEMTIISPEPRSASVTASRDTLVFKVYQFKLKMFPGLVSELYLNIARILEKRLRNNNVELASLTVKMMNTEGSEGEAVSSEDANSALEGEASEGTAESFETSNATSQDLFMRTEGDLSPPPAPPNVKAE